MRALEKKIGKVLLIRFYPKTFKYVENFVSWITLLSACNHFNQYPICAGINIQFVQEKSKIAKDKIMKNVYNHHLGSTGYARLLHKRASIITTL